MADKKTYRKEIALNGRMITGDDPAKVGENFQQLVNMRYEKKRPVGIGGMTKINSTAIPTYTKTKSGIHYRKDQPSESHVLVEARDSSDNARILQNTTAIPNTGDFSATPLFTPTSGADIGRWSIAPDGDVAYCNSEESCIWGGDEREVSGFINYDPGDNFKYDYLDKVRTSSTDEEAVLNLVTGGIDANTLLLLHLDNNVTDSSPTTAHTVTNNNVTFSASGSAFGTHRADFTTNAYLTVPDNADFDLSGGVFTIDARIEVDDDNVDYSFYYQNTTNDDDSFNCLIDTNGAVVVRIKAAATKQFTGAADFQTENGIINEGTTYHIQIVENGDAWYIFVDGVLTAFTSDDARAANYTGLVQIGYDGSQYFEGKMDEFRVSNVARNTSNFDIPTDAYSSDDDMVYIYLGSLRPLQGFKLYIGTANTDASTMTVEYWDGSDWAAVSSLSDGTDTGASLSQTGSVTFSSTVATAKQKYLNEDLLYWYKIYIDSVSANTSIYYVTVDAPFQEIKDLWDGEPVTIDFAQRRSNSTYKDITLKIRENEYTSGDSGTYADIGGLDSPDEDLVFGFYERMVGLHFHFVSGDENNNNNTVATVKYWNGADWTSVGSVDDGTYKNTRSFGGSGVMSWNEIDNDLEFTRSINNDYQLYYYKVSFSKDLSSDVNLFYVTGIRAQIEISAYKFPFFANDRLWLCADMKGHKNSAICSNQGTSHIFNGEDSLMYEFGDESELTGGAWLYSQYGSSIYNITIFFKKNETWAIIGNDPEEWAKYRLSATVGCVDPETIKTVDINQQGVNSSVVIWRADTGIYMSDGRKPILLSEDISNVFDKRLSTAISSSVESKSFWDVNEKEYHFLWAQGTSTTLDKEYVLYLDKPGWFEIDRGSPLQYGIEVKDTNGRGYTHGFIDTGYMFRLEYGTTFNGEDIEHILRFGDIALHDGSVSIETKAEHHGLIAVAKSTTENEVSITHYGDGKSTGSSWTHSSNKSGYRLLEPVEHTHTNNHIFHSWKMVMSTNDETYGFEPLYFFVLYSITPPGNHMQDRRQ